MKIEIVEVNGTMLAKMVSEDFIRESNKMGRVFFVTSLDEAIKRLSE